MEKQPLCLPKYGCTIAGLSVANLKETLMQVEMGYFYVQRRDYIN